jgi:anti-sigma B factor antagonist
MAVQGDNDNWFRKDDFSTHVSEGDDGSVKVSLAGEFDLSTAADLRACLVRPEVLGAKKVQVDLVRVTFFDSSSIGVLVAACKHVRSTGGAFGVICNDGPALRVLEISGLVDYFGVMSAAEAASSDTVPFLDGECGGLSHQ